MHWGGCDALFEAVHTVAVRTVLILGAPSASWLSFISQDAVALMQGSLALVMSKLALQVKCG